MTTRSPLRARCVACAVDEQVDHDVGEALWRHRRLRVIADVHRDGHIQIAVQGSQVAQQRTHRRRGRLGWRGLDVVLQQAAQPFQLGARGCAELPAVLRRILPGLLGCEHALRPGQARDQVAHLVIAYRVVSHRLLSGLQPGLRLRQIPPYGAQRTDGERHRGGQQHGDSRQPQIAGSRGVLRLAW